MGLDPGVMNFDFDFPQEFQMFLSWILKDFNLLLLIHHFNWFLKLISRVEDDVKFDGYCMLLGPINSVTLWFTVVANETAFQCSFIEFSSILYLHISWSTKMLNTGEVEFSPGYHLIWGPSIKCMCWHQIKNPTCMSHSLGPEVVR